VKAMSRLPLAIEHPENFYRGVINGICFSIPLWLVIILSAWQLWGVCIGT
jgi:hypothetical protein